MNNDEATARDRAIEDARAWLQEIIDDRPEGAYEGAYDANDQRHARTVLRALAGAPTADVADLPARLKRGADAAWEIRGTTAAIKLGELARALDKYPADAVEAIGRALAAPAVEPEDADVAECNGECFTASDVGVTVADNPVAYPHPDCPLHGTELRKALDALARTHKDWEA